MATGFSGWSPEAVQFFRGLWADTKTYWSVHEAFCETSVREPMALLDELSGISARDVRFRAG